MKKWKLNRNLKKKYAELCNSHRCKIKIYENLLGRQGLF
mgnify:CR=1 FL=1